MKNLNKKAIIKRIDDRYVVYSKYEKPTLNLLAPDPKMKVYKTKIRAMKEYNRIKELI